MSAAVELVRGRINLALSYVQDLRVSFHQPTPFVVVLNQGWSQEDFFTAVETLAASGAVILVHNQVPHLEAVCLFKNFSEPQES